MKIFLDTANIEEVRRAVEMGVISGVTTNPSLLLKEKGSFENVIKQICSLIDGPVSVEGAASDCVYDEALSISKIAKNVVVKIPVTETGLCTIKNLTYEDIKTNATLIFSVNQALLAAEAGASYVSIFVGRLDDIGHDGMQVVRDTVKMLKAKDCKTEVIAASIRHPFHVTEAILAEAHIATIPFTVLEKMIHHPLTDIGIQKFLDDWRKR